MGSELRFQPECTHTYLGSPSLVRAPDGSLVATHDYFGPDCPRNHEQEEALTSVYRSEDDGVNWRNVTHILNCYWSSLFVAGGRLYLLGVSQQYGSIVIRRSDDSGYTWTQPADEHSGLLAAGGVQRTPPNYHCAPVPVLEHEGRIYKAFEDCTSNVWGSGFQALVLSVPKDADLLQACYWRMSNRLPFSPAWLPAAQSNGSSAGWLEGNVVADPKNQLWNILRCHIESQANTAARMRILDEGHKLDFDPALGFMNFPGGHTKFTIRRDPDTGWYLALVNDSSNPTWSRQRNRLSLIASRDLQDWQIVKTLVHDTSGLSPADSIRLTGFQYVDWQFDGLDLIYLVRTAWRGAPNYHDSNRIVFHRERSFRALLSAVNCESWT